MAAESTAAKGQGSFNEQHSLAAPNDPEERRRRRRRPPGRVLLVEPLHHLTLTCKTRWRLPEGSTQMVLHGN